VCPPPAAPPGSDLWTAVYNVPPNSPPYAPGTSVAKDVEVIFPKPPEQVAQDAQQAAQGAEKAAEDVAEDAAAVAEDAEQQAEQAAQGGPQTDLASRLPSDPGALLARLFRGAAATFNPKDKRADDEQQAEQQAYQQQESAAPAPAALPAAVAPAVPVDPGPLAIDVPDMARSKSRRLSN